MGTGNGVPPRANLSYRTGAVPYHLFIHYQSSWEVRISARPSHSSRIRRTRWYIHTQFGLDLFIIRIVLFRVFVMSPPPMHLEQIMYADSRRSFSQQALVHLFCLTSNSLLSSETHPVLDSFWPIWGAFRSALRTHQCWSETEAHFITRSPRTQLCLLALLSSWPPSIYKHPFSILWALFAACC